MKFKLFGYNITIEKSKRWLNEVLKELDKVNGKTAFSLKIARIKKARELSKLFPNNQFEKLNVDGTIFLSEAKKFVEKYYSD